MGCGAGEPAHLIAVAGGDGTVGSVAKRMAGREIPLAVLPMGTANNISRTLGLADIAIEDHILGWQAAPKVRFDVGVAKGPWGSTSFIEGLGVGLFAWTMPAADASPTLANLNQTDAKIAYALQMLKDRLQTCPAIEIKASLDGKDISGEYVLFEAMNMQYIGPNLYLAPDGNPGDGYLDVVMVTNAERAKLHHYLSSWQKGALRAADLPSCRGRHLQMEWTGYKVHIDDSLWPDDERSAPPPPGIIDVTLKAEALELCCPA